MPASLTFPTAAIPEVTGVSPTFLSLAFEPLGCGIVRPFRRTERADFDNDCGEPLVRTAVGQILGTVKGALPWRTEFGCNATKRRHKARTEALGALIRVDVEEALQRWEPRVQLRSVDVDKIRVGEKNLVRVTTVYRLGDTGEEQEVVALF